MAKQIRIFRPKSNFCGKTTISTIVHRWIWVSGGGVIVEKKTGGWVKSKYSLKELINGDEAVEIS